METFPLVTIATVNFNSGPSTSFLLNSALKLNYPKKKIEVIIVDNASEDDSAPMLESVLSARRFKALKRSLVIRSETNGGVGKALNLAIGNSSPMSEFVWRVDNDVEFDPPCLRELLSVFRGDGLRRIGAVSSRVVNRDSGSEEMSASVFLPVPRRWTRVFQRIDEVGSEPGSGSRVVLLTGTSCLFRRSVFDNVGLYDERFFLYCEDRELCLRMDERGYQLKVARGAITYHHTSTSTSRLGEEKIYYLVRNQLLWGTLYFRGVEKILFLFFQIISTPWRIVRYRQTFSHFRIYAIVLQTLSGIRDFAQKRFGMKGSSAMDPLRGVG